MNYAWDLSSFPPTPHIFLFVGYSEKFCQTELVSPYPNCIPTVSNTIKKCGVWVGNLTSPMHIPSVSRPDIWSPARCLSSIGFASDRVDNIMSAKIPLCRSSSMSLVFHVTRRSSLHHCVV